MKHKRGRFRAAYHKAAAKLGTLLKIVACLAPAGMIAYGSYVYNTKDKFQFKDLLPIMGDFGSCFTGILVSADGTINWRPERLLAGWGPVLVIGGITWAERTVHMSGANPFRVMSALG